VSEIFFRRLDSVDILRVVSCCAVSANVDVVCWIDPTSFPTGPAGLLVGGDVGSVDGGAWPSADAAPVPVTTPVPKLTMIAQAASQRVRRGDD
jgi:hypothetical protein